MRHDNVLNDTLQMDEDHDNVLDDSIQIVEDIMTGRHDDILNDSIQIDEDLSQSLLAKSKRRKSSLYEATQAFISVSNNTIIESFVFPVVLFPICSVATKRKHCLQLCNNVQMCNVHGP